jgi:predicted ArsR family transcriptional regulator
MDKAELNGVDSFRDPHDEIDEAEAQRAAKELDIPRDEVRRRFEALADRFRLKLAWLQPPPS